MAQATTERVLKYKDVVRRFDPVMGLEVHVELNTQTKMFCPCPTTFGAPPNTQVCGTCLALPGAMPVLNKEGLASAIKIGLALNCSIAERCRFARKNYFYPDMPKNFQTSQYDEPIAFDGYLDVDVPASDHGEAFTYRVQIERAHMEEDTGKSTHMGGSTGRIHGADYSLVDYNRAGIPLIEIVTKPLEGCGDRAPEVAKAYVAALRDILRGLKVSDVKMEQGSLRCDANVSLREKVGDDPNSEEQRAVPLGIRSETKNVNSLRSIERAIRYEMTRHAARLDDGKTVVQETRHWHEDTGVTTSGRSKEEAEDYRYFPEPDLLPVEPDPAWVAELKAALPEPPAKRRARLQADYGFSDLEMRDVVNAGVLDVIEETVKAGAKPAAARKWWTGDVLRRATEAKIPATEVGLTVAHVVELAGLVEEGRLNDALARQVVDGVIAGEGTPAEVADARGLTIVQDDGALSDAIDAVIEADPKTADKIRGGAVQAAGRFIGQVMKAMGGKADAAKVRQMILEKLGQ